MMTLRYDSNYDLIVPNVVLPMDFLDSKNASESGRSKGIKVNGRKKVDGRKKMKVRTPKNGLSTINF